MDIETKVFVGQKAFIDKDGKILVLKDPNYLTKDQKGLDFPGGRFRYGNELVDELKREVTEETGLEIEVGKPFFVWTNFNTKRTDNKIQVVLIGYFCKYKSGEVVISDEHVGYEWVDANNFQNWKDNTDYYKALEKYFELKKMDP